MNTKVAALTLLAAASLVTTGCANDHGQGSNKSSDRTSAYRMATDRGFAPQAYSGGPIDVYTYVDVTFGRCFGRLRIGSDDVTLLFQHAVAGASADGPSEVSQVDEPQVSKLKDDSAYKEKCFS